MNLVNAMLQIKHIPENIKRYINGRRQALREAEMISSTTQSVVDDISADIEDLKIIAPDTQQIAKILKSMHDRLSEICYLIKGISGGAEYLSHTEAANFLGVSIDTLYGYVSTKAIPRRKNGGMNFYKIDDLRQFIQSKKSIKCKNAGCDTDIDMILNSMAARFDVEGEEKMCIYKILKESSVDRKWLKEISKSITSWDQFKSEIKGH